MRSTSNSKVSQKITFIEISKKAYEESGMGKRDERVW
jgi:hypothetical protein